MEQVTAYKSVDGKIFETTEECQKHERNLFPMFNSSGDPCGELREAYFVYIDSVKLKKLFIQQHCDAVPNNLGLWYYDINKSKWVNDEDYLSSFIKARDKIIRFINYNLTKEN